MESRDRGRAEIRAHQLAIKWTADRRSRPSRRSTPWCRSRSRRVDMVAYLLEAGASIHSLYVHPEPKGGLSFDIRGQRAGVGARLQASDYFDIDKGLPRARSNSLGRTTGISRRTPARKRLGEQRAALEEFGKKLARQRAKAGPQ